MTSPKQPALEEIVLATHNSGKIAELQALLYPIQCISIQKFGLDAPAETHATFIENALLKARYTCSKTKKPALADDSGLVVPALNGQPGILSARYAGENTSDAQNIALLLEQMQNIPHTERQAYFYCALVLLKNETDPTPTIAIGTCHGHILTHPIGNHGFGYDPIFYVPKYQCSFAQLTLTQKNQISHRAQALQKLRDQICC